MLYNISKENKVMINKEQGSTNTNLQNYLTNTKYISNFMQHVAMTCKQCSDVPGSQCFSCPHIGKSGCWQWTGARDSRNFPRFLYYGKSQLAHRVVYALYQISMFPHWKLESSTWLTPCKKLPHNDYCVNPTHIHVKNRPLTKPPLIECNKRYYESYTECYNIESRKVLLPAPFSKWLKKVKAGMPPEQAFNWK
jgi:hypothetical protein